MMKLEEILSGINVVEIKGNITKEISGLEIDSRKIEPGHMFVAVKGTQTDGHAYIGKAIKGCSKFAYNFFRIIDFNIGYI